MLTRSPAIGAAAPRFNLILQPEFPLNALVLVSDALRIANQNSGRELFRWSFVSESGGEVRASNGMWLGVDCDIEQMPAADVYLLFEGNLPTQNTSPRLCKFLRAAARSGGMVGAVDTGAFALAQAGVIPTESAVGVVLHWEAAPAFRERHPRATIRDQVYLVDENRVHCAGGVAALDMVLALIERFHGAALANEVANALVHTRREAGVAQRGDGSTDAGPDSLSVRIVSLMEKHLDFPLTLPELSARLGVTRRKLARACQRAFGESPMRLYLHIRLQAARNFLFYEEYSIKDVANACGFSYPAVFSRVFRAHFDQTPREFRARLRERQNSSVRPEIRRLIRNDSGDKGLRSTGQPTTGA